MRWEITRSTEDTAGDLFEATNWIDAGMPGPPVHVHPTAEESYAVIEGALEVFMNGEWSPVRAGEKATAPPGVPHSVRNASDEPARVENVHIRRLPPKDPRSAIYAAMLFGNYPDEIRATKPPNGVFKALAFVGRAFRFKLEA